MGGVITVGKAIEDFSKIKEITQDLSDEDKAQVKELAELLPKYFALERAPPKTPLRFGNDIASDENTYIEKRDAVAKAALDSLFTSADGKAPEGRTPRVALCFSGGGNRALIGTVAFLNWFKKHGLIDAATYVAGLSGSTWCLVPWFASKGNPFVGARNKDGSVKEGVDPWSADCEPEVAESAMHSVQGLNIIASKDFCRSAVPRLVLQKYRPVRTQPL